MPEEPQVTGVEPESGVGPEPAQPVGPSTEAAGVAAAPAATQATEPTEDALAKFQERLSRQQAILDRKRAEAERVAKTERDRAETLQAELDQERMKGMTEQQKAALITQRERERFEAERQAFAQDAAAVEEAKMQLAWYREFLGKGVPPQKLDQCEDFAQMYLAYDEHMRAQVEAAKQSAAPAPAPTVGRGDKVHTGGFGAPPSREFDRLVAEGHGPGTKEYREYIRKIKRSGATELI